MAVRVTGTLSSELTGRTVWFRTNECDMNSGTVRHVEGGDDLCIDYVGKRGVPRVFHAYRDDVFLTKEDLISDNHRRFMAKVDACCRQMATVQDLVSFCYMHMAPRRDGETDYVAKAAIRKKAKELLGFEVDPQSAAQEKEWEKEVCGDV